jgi:CRISPR-associated endonuclease/helicase Cas3
MKFEEMFRMATGYAPYPYQTRLATGSDLPNLIDIPTGLGKTAAVVLSWIYRRRFAGELSERTPRRLVYCLPMRVLVEQTRDNVILWLNRLGILGGEVVLEGEKGRERIKDYTPSWDDPTKVNVTVLMGGEDRDEWDIHPECDAIIIGTQDMLLSRVLNRGYGMSRYRWPVHFGLLDNDCIWIVDEVQLMGNGLPTSVQLEVFRREMSTYGPTHSLFMSATLDPNAFRTVDNPSGYSKVLSLETIDAEVEVVRRKIGCTKSIKKLDVATDEPRKIAEEVKRSHKPFSRTIIVVNTIKRAVDLYLAIRKSIPSVPSVLIHSQFRPPDRRVQMNRILAPASDQGTIIVSTQVIEAGVDISCRTLITDLAPWSSMVQRFGRCNRNGEYPDAEVYWLDLLGSGNTPKTAPYTIEELQTSRNILTAGGISNVSPSSLPKVKQVATKGFTLRRKDIVELFDTTMDITGSDIDISRFIRDVQDTDVFVFWREIDGDGPSENEPKPHREELCPAHLSDLKSLVEKGSHIWSWDSLEREWVPIRNQRNLHPGQTILMDAREGHYSTEVGWNAKERERVTVYHPIGGDGEEGYERDKWATSTWMTISEHTDKVVEVAEHLLRKLPIADNATIANVVEAARWHDSGKAHSAFQAMIKSEERGKVPADPLAKAPPGVWKLGRLPHLPDPSDGRRKNFRHELASGLLVMINGKEDLVAYLATAHHGKVRLSIRSMPEEYLPDNPDKRYARGVWDGDIIPETALGGGVIVPKTVLDLSYMELGEGPLGHSWSSRMIELRDRKDLGIFRLAFLESIIKAADERASGGAA